MKKVILFFAVLFICGQIAAQEVRTDSVAVAEKSEEKKDTLSSRFLLDLLMNSLETEYDVILGYVLPDSFIAYRNNRYMLVNAYTGEEKVIATRDDEYDIYNHQKN